MRKNVSSSSTKRDTKNNQPVVFNSFSRGIIKDPPAGKIADALSDGYNITTFPGYYEGRTGCRKVDAAEFPAIVTGISASKVGNRIVTTSSAPFTEEHVGCFFGFGGYYELIADYVSAGEVVGSDTTYREAVNGRIIGPQNIWWYHRTLRLWILMIGRMLYSAPESMSAWSSIPVISKDYPSNSLSDFAEYKNLFLIFNSNGMYKIDGNLTFPIAYKTNIDPPNIRILSTAYDETLGHRHRYRYIYGGMRIEANGEIVDRQTLDRIGMETGTNAADENNIDYAEVGTVDEVSETNPIVVQELWMPVIPNTNPVEYQWHLTHYSIYRTPDLESINALDPNRSEYNDPSVFVWNKDLRTCAAFYLTISAGIIELKNGQLEDADRYSILELDDGQRFEMTEILTSRTARIGDDYYDLEISSCAGAIGNGRVFRGTVTDGVLTRTHGDVFTSADARKTIFNSSGYKLYITEFIDENNVRLHIDVNMSVQGFTMDPTHRTYCDVISDEILFARKDFYTCNMRYKKPMPNCNVGAIIPDFIVCAIRGQKEIYFSNITDDSEIGQYVPIQRSDIVQDPIMVLWRFQDMLAIICSNSTWGTQIGLTGSIPLPGSNKTVSIISGVKQLSKSTGCVDYTSVCEVPGDMIALITNEQGTEALRLFNGTTYSETDFFTDATYGGRMLKDLLKTKKFSQSVYNGNIGLVVWRKNT